MTAPTLPRPTHVGTAIVRTVMVRDGVYRVTVEHAATGFLVDELCHSYPRPEQATRAHDMAAALLADHTPAQLVELLAVFQTPPSSGAATEAAGRRGHQLPPCEQEAA